MLRNIVLIGSGKLATQLGSSLVKKGFNIRQVFSRTHCNAEELAERLNAYATDRLSEIQLDADLYIIALTDAAIETTIEQMPKVNGIVVHTAGSLAMDMLGSFENYGIFYPFQTFSKEREVDFSEIPILIEANGELVCKKLESFAKAISQTVMVCDSNQRQQIHLAAVFACNFSNHMYVIAESILKKYDISFDVLKPLIKETALKTEFLSPVKAQTGPAIRGDKNVIDKHLSMLGGDEELAELYSKLTQRIEVLGARGKLLDE
ncbi:Rossmann-like and DUF2520 domain-containing protein [Saccharicrinis fermentans]|uniref:DUF2520 domain-containing protein n=1 Tax=Saccharicrinis fermentans DSM 9555 = JCM 21142 TaxID=869213 RepID=W7YCR4_9BACT|nr:Rossmann-like and DUF2520 domain-containing protein [Saccharicrinis fermentans]GAF02241.1 hypothetical protein JCM21142_3870 [Saccharicrinis fermentans DSM 9555 = JCM 21142]